MRRIVALAVAALVVMHSTSTAQTCTGLPTFSSGRTQLLGSGSFADGANSFGAGLGIGVPGGIFARGMIGTTSYDNLDGSSFDLGGQVGYQTTLGESRTVQLCPVGGFMLGFGPNDIEGTGIDASSRSLNFGFALGTALPSGPNVQIVPNGGLSLAYSKAELEDSDGDAQLENSETYGIINLGVGFVFNSTIGVSPSVSIPVGLEDSDASFNLAFALHFGRRQ